MAPQALTRLVDCAGACRAHELATLAGPQLAAFVKQLGARLGSCAPVSQRESARSALATIGWDAAGNAPLAGSGLPAFAAVIACIEWLSAEVGPELQQQPYDFYAVLDFEATCEEGARIRPQEIIEFPTVLLDGATLEPVAEFHSACGRPTGQCSAGPASA